MDLFTLYEKTFPQLPTNRAKDIKTAVRTLAKALGYNDPHHCPTEAYTKPLPTIYHLIEQHLSGKGPHTIRNTKNNLSMLFRTADTHQLLPLTPTKPTQNFTAKQFYKKPRRIGYESGTHIGYYLADHKWPPALTAEFAKFTAWATAPFTEGRPAKWRKRATTINLYRNGWQSFFGYLTHIQHLPTIEYNQLFDWPLVHAYVTWHVNEQHHKATITIHNFLRNLLTLTHQYHPDPELHTKIKTLKNNLPTPTPTYNKSDVWVPLATLNEIGKALWPNKAPKDIQGLGTRTAQHAGLSLMLQLWCRRPYRQRNMREMELDKNLYRDTTGKWIIRFVGDQLKIGEKRGRINEFTLPFPQDLVSTLEDYLTHWRPLLPTSKTLHNVFLSHNGPYNSQTLRGVIRRTIFCHTKKALHPHLIRSIWATEYIMSTGNYGRAAIMLNDRIETVLKQYAHLTEHGVAEQTDQWVANKFTA